MVTRKVALNAGDVLNLSVQGAMASVVLVEGAGAPLTLIGNAANASVSFRAPQTATFTFQFTAASQARASIGVRCASIAAANANAAFLARRKDLINTRDPDRIRIDRAPKPITNPDQPFGSNVALDDQGRPKQVTFSVSLSEIEAAAGSGKPQPGLVDVFLEGRMQSYDAMAALGETSGNLGVIYLGTRSKIGPDILVGGLAQFDRGVETTQYGASDMAATGWMAGPYLSMRLASGVVFDGRVAWGKTEDASGIGEGTSETERELVRAKLTGTRDLHGWKLAPSVGLVYLEDALRDGDTGETKVAGIGKVEVLPEVSRRFQLDGDAYVEPRAAAGGYLGFDNLSTLESTITSQALADDMRLKAEAGVAVGIKDGTSLQATGAVESGVVSETTETWSGRLQLNVPLGK
jgi:hypothetical protein